MIGSVFRLGRGLERWRLFFPALCETVVVTLGIVACKFIEHALAPAETMARSRAISEIHPMKR